MSDNTNLQPPLPKRYKLPPIVNPIWHLSDFVKFIGAPEKLRKIICQQYGVKHCLLLDRARSGLYLLIKGMALNDEWITTSFMHRPASVVIKNHVDSLVLSSIKKDFTIDVEDVSGLISEKTQVILATHMYGKAADIVNLRSLADRHGLFLIENAVHMFGNVQVKNKKLGSWGDAAILSFNVDKPVGGLLGGALITNRDDVWEAVSGQTLGESNKAECWNRIYTSYLSYRLKPLILRFATNNLRQAKDGIGEVESFDFNKYQHYLPRTIHAIQAATARYGFEHSVEITQRRIKNAEFLSSLLVDNKKIILPSSSEQCPNTYLYYPVLFTEDINRYKIGSDLSKLGIESKWRYYPLHLQPDFTDCKQSDLTKTTEYWQQHLLLPVSPNVSKQQLEYLSETLSQLVTTLSDGNRPAYQMAPANYHGFLGIKTNPGDIQVKACRT